MDIYKFRIIQQLIAGRDLDGDTAYAMFCDVLRNEQPDLQQGAFLAALVAKGETTDELYAAWRAIDEIDTVHVTPGVDADLREFGHRHGRHEHDQRRHRRRDRRSSGRCGHGPARRTRALFALRHGRSTKGALAGTRQRRRSMCAPWWRRWVSAAWEAC